MTFLFGKVVIWTGKEGLDVYSEVHQNLGNEVIHTLFLPVIIFSILRWVHLLVKCDWLARFAIFLMFVFYSNFYSLVGTFDDLVWMSLTVPIIILAELPKFKLNKLGASLCFVIPLIVQEIVGHTLFEGVNSRLTVSHVINAILYTPMFYSQGVWRGMTLLVPYFVPNEVGKILAGSWTICFGLYISSVLFEQFNRKKKKAF